MGLKEAVGVVVCDTVAKVCRKIKPDGCTLVPDFDFRSCCDQHDVEYRLQVVSRKEADQRLRACIRSSGHPLKAELYYLGVRLFGGIFWFRNRRL